MLIYKITNKINGKWYIGKQHNENSKYLGSGILIKRAISKYGVENFIKEILEKCESKNLNEREMYWINKTNAVADLNSYNLATGGEGGDTFTGSYKKGSPEWKMYLKKIRSRKGKENGMFGKKGPDHPKYGFKESDETRKKKTKALVGRVLSIETKQKIGKKTKERCKDEKYRKRLGELISKSMTDEVRKKISATKKKRDYTGSKHHNSKKVSIKGKTYPSLTAAIKSKKIGVNRMGTVIKHLKDDNMTDWFYF